jgi:hypothetical protein
VSLSIPVRQQGSVFILPRQGTFGLAGHPRTNLPEHPKISPSPWPNRHTSGIESCADSTPESGAHPAANRIRIRPRIGSASEGISEKARSGIRNPRS